MRRVSVGMSHKAVPDVDDGFGDRTPAYIEYTHSSRRSKFQNLRNDSRTNLIQKRIMVNLGLLKSGKVEMENTIDQGNLRKLLGI